MDFPSTYDPQSAEDKWYTRWEEGRYFHADEESVESPYSIVIPPPNVTGTLHMGHALNNTLQDILVRWRRMKGFSTLWMPGMDHAGIATQNVVERLLAEEGKDRHDLGREAFEKRVWEWKEHSGGQIKDQLKRLGSSLDWDRERFTLDEGLSRAVRKVFVTLYKEGLIYRGNRIINWCPRCKTALSDIETEYRDLDGHLWHMRYPFVDGKGHVTVATTRPETMLGDTAVAVHPDDERYKDLVGKKIVLPLANREIPVVADDFVDPEFGSGCVKVTPAHDPNDFEIGQRHNLPEIRVIDDDAKITSEGGPYEGLDRYEARKKVLADLDAQGLLEKTDDHDHSVGHCYRCNTVIEPSLSLQWFVKIKPLAEPAIAAVEEGRIRFVPANWSKTYYEWMRNIRDWCISRQLWWGHRIPAFYCNECGHINVDMEDPDTCEKCGSKDLTQDTDVLDTWFSSGLWPFSTMGWPDETKTLEKYYPTSTLVTGFDIIFFWVARMIMMGLKFMDDVPFRDVYIHALVRDEHGQKMSKSRGNVIDPLIMMEKYGTDAFRFTLAAFAAQGRDIILSEKRIEGYRSFINKIWNSTRFIMMNLGDDFTPRTLDSLKLERFDKWILFELHRTLKEVNEALEEYRFNEVAQRIYEFYWHEFCDWYLELTKQRLYADDSHMADSMETARQVLYHVLVTSLKIMHPVMPFITEEIWEIIQGEGAPYLIVSPWPETTVDPSWEKDARDTRLFMDIVYRIRNIRGEMNIAPNVKPNAVFKTSSGALHDLIIREDAHIKALAKVDEIIIDAEYEPEKTDAVAVMSEMEIYIPLAGSIDFEAEKARLNREIEKITKDLVRVQGKLGNDKFLAKAPEDVVAKERAKEAEMREILEGLQQSLDALA